MMNLPSRGVVHSHPFPAGQENLPVVNIPNLTAQIVNGLTTYNIESMVKRFKELPFLGSEENITVAAKMVFEKAIEDVPSSTKFVTFIHLVCKKQKSITEKRFKVLITDLCFQNLQHRRVGGGANNRRGTLQLMGELFVLHQAMYHQGIFECVEMLMSSKTDDNLQDLCYLLLIAGKQLEQQTNFISDRVKSIQSGATLPMPKFVPHPDWMEAQFRVLNKCSEDPSLSGETRSKLHDVIRQKQFGWKFIVDRIQQNQSNPPPKISKSFQDAFPPKSGTPSFKSSQESVSSSSSFGPASRQTTLSNSTTSLKSNSSEVMSKPVSSTKFDSPGSSKSQINTKPKTVPVPVVPKDLSNLKPEDAMVHILKTLHAGNVPAVALKITNLPFADDFERVYAMVSNMLDRSEKDSSFLAGLHTQVENELAQLEKDNSTVSNNGIVSSPAVQQDDKETQTSQKLTVDAEVATDSDFLAYPVVRPEGDITPKSSQYGNPVEIGGDLQPEANWQKMVGSLLTPNSMAPPAPALKYLSMYSNYDRMLQKLGEEDAEDLNMEICNLIFQRLKLRGGKLGGR
ncbi:uncharacterized protein LOC110855664 [Folsomia candida]|uniref:uncharacterized protein LOC110855664 n=1 Tax=Folsomia candida TaxID=158441 RepID=UPI0016051714|nr:uncharacterized protein LOC110855664 [Folsomia candida]